MHSLSSNLVLDVTTCIGQLSGWISSLSNHTSPTVRGEVEITAFAGSQPSNNKANSLILSPACDMAWQYTQHSEKKGPSLHFLHQL